MTTSIIALMYIFELLMIVQIWLEPLTNKQDKLNQELNDLKKELIEIKRNIYIMGQGEEQKNENNKN